MAGVIEALHIYDEHNNPILSHTYAGRPLSAAHLLPLYLAQIASSGTATSTTTTTQPPPLVYLPETHPPTLAFSIVHAQLRLVATTSGELEPLLALEFLHRVADALEAFLGGGAGPGTSSSTTTPLLAGRIEAEYDVVAQLLTEMCDAGAVGGTTEADALRDLVAVEGLVGRLLGSLTLPGKGLPLGVGGSPLSSSSPSPSPSPMEAMSFSSSAAATSSSLPWRRAAVRHTSNELYADVVESLAVTLAPSGRPLAATAHGSIAFTAKVSGVPEIVVTLAGPAGGGSGSGRAQLAGLLALPVFHPCVRLARWRERPGELSFVPPDGRFVLAGYEVDLMGTTTTASTNTNLRLPLHAEVRTSLGPAGADFEVRVHVNRTFVAAPSSGIGISRGLGPPHAGTPAAPVLEDVRIAVPLPAAVRNLVEVRPSRGDAVYNPGDRLLEWLIPAKDMAAGVSYFGLRCTAVGERTAEEENTDVDGDSYGFDYEYQRPGGENGKNGENGNGDGKNKNTDGKPPNDSSAAASKMLMPTSATVSFAVRGWLASGVRVESIVVDAKRSRGLGDGVKPFKGVKYLTVSKGGIELRC